MHVYNAVLTVNVFPESIALAVSKKRENVLIAKIYPQNAALIVSSLYIDLLKDFINC